MADTVDDWLGLVAARYPPSTAADWDEVGLHVGAREWPVERVLVALDVTTAVIDEAAAGPATLLLAHHPLFFNPLQRLTPDTADGKLALRAARTGVAVAAAHTNLDVAADGAGTSDPVADLLDLRDGEPLTSESRHGPDKLVTFVPPEAVEEVIDALAEAGAGRIGDYERCSFRVRGTGTFTPASGSDPYSGQVGRDNAADELRVEMELAAGTAGRAVRALRAAHPYEEVAYDLYPTQTGGALGFGRIGRLPEPTRLRVVAERIREELPAPYLRAGGDPERRVETVAVVGGAGQGLIGAARAAGADVLVTGDLRHHVALDARQLGLALIDAGHHATEVAALPAWTDRLRDGASARGLAAEVIASSVHTGPWTL